MARNEQASRLRGQLASADRSGPGKGFPKGLRRAVADYAAAAVAAGESTESIARDLGVSAMSIKRWCEHEHHVPAPHAQLRRVEILPSASSVMPAGHVASLVVRSPNGLVVEGLSVEQAVQLLRALG